MDEAHPGRRAVDPRLRVTALLALALALWLSGAVQKSFWEDEAWTATQAVKSAAGILQATAADRHPPLYFLAAGAWSRVFGAQEVGLRSLSILFSLGSLLLAYRLARRFSGENAAVAALALLVCSPFLLMYAHTARYYALAMLLSLAAVDQFLRYLDGGGWIHLAGYAMLGAAMLYTSYPTLGVLLACNLWWLLQARQKRSAWLPWLGAQALVALAFIPWLPALGAQAQKDLAGLPAGLDLLLEAAKRMAYLGYAFGLGETLSPLNPAAWLGAAALLGMLVLAFRSARGEAWLPLLVFACVAGVNLLISLVSAYPVAGWQGIPNRMLYGLPFLIMWLAAPFGAPIGEPPIGRAFSGRPQRGWLVLPRLLPGLLLAVYAVAGFNYFTGREFIKPFLDVPWRLMMSMVAERSHGEAAVVCGPGEYACFYYVQRYGYRVFRPAEWAQVEQAGIEDVWWVRSNLGEPERESGGDAQGVAEAHGLYWLSESASFARQSDSLRWLKTKYLGQLDYAYRVNLFHFVRGEPQP